jgi:MoaA/NifB/PqqE/SkfB family radical SAM enzyme
MNLPSRFISWLTINRACNLRCGSCYAKTTGFSTEEDMSIETVKQSINLLKELPLKSVIVIGGEPTIHPQFLEIVSMLRMAGLRPLLVTNSIRLADSRFLEAVIQAGIVGITTSLKATSEEQYQAITGRKGFSTTMKAIENIERVGIFHKVSVTLYENLLDDFDEMIDVVVKSGVRLFSLDLGRPIIVDNRVYADGIAYKLWHKI